MIDDCIFIADLGQSSSLILHLFIVFFQCLYLRKDRVTVLWGDKGRSARLDDGELIYVISLFVQESTIEDKPDAKAIPKPC